MRTIKIPTNWYVLYTSANAEKKVEVRLREKAYKCWLPVHRSPRVWSDRIKMIDAPLFRSYIFIYCRENQLYSIPHHVYGVSSIIYHNGKPAIMRQQDIDAIAEFLRHAENQEITVGQEVEILTGPMKHVSGIIRRIEKNKIQLYLEQLGVLLTVQTKDVAPVDRI
jgi:transcription antitermination factor NusG